MDNYNNQMAQNRFLCREKALQEVGCEVALPDYRPEIKRLLWVEARATPPAAYLSAGTAEVSGEVDYRVLYAGGDGALYSFSHTDSYRYTLPADPGSECDPSLGVSVGAEMLAENAGGRVLGPRRLHLRCRLSADVSLYGSEREEPLPSGETVERLMATYPVAEMLFGMGETQGLADELPVEGAEEGLRVIDADSRVFVTEAEAGSGCVTCRGEVALRVLAVCEGSEEGPFVLTRRIPFRGEIPVEGALVNCQGVARGQVRNLRVTVEEGKLHCDMELTLWAAAGRNRDCNCVLDLYATQNRCENQYRVSQMQALERMLCANFTWSGGVDLAEAGFSGGEELIESRLFCLAPTAQVENGRLTLSGKCLCRMLCRLGDEYTVREAEIPYRYQPEGVYREGEDQNCYPHVEAITHRARPDGDRILWDAELAVTVCTCSENRVRVLKNARMGEELPQASASRTLCYPAPDDTLWSVGKRYNLPMWRILGQNDLPAAPAANSKESLGGASVLLI